MANMNTLFRRGCLLAVVLMAANMLVINEMKAMENENNITEPPIITNLEFNQNNKNFNQGQNKVISPERQQGDSTHHFGNENLNEINQEEFSKRTEQENEDVTQKQKKQKVQNFFDSLLSLANYVNFFGTFALSGANNYFKWWNYDAGRYREFGCLGYRTKKLFGISQFDININLGRGISWLIIGFLFFVVQGYSIYSTEKRDSACSLAISLLFFLTIYHNPKTIYNNPKNVEKEKKLHIKVIAFLLSILQGFVSVPLTFHISNFSISLSLDSMLWELVAIWAREKVYEIHKGKEHAIKND